MTIVFRKSFWSTLRDQINVRLLRSMTRRRRAQQAPRMFLAPDDYIGETILAEVMFEKGYLSALDALLDRLGTSKGPGTVALDIGSNIGNHALHFSRRFGHVHCFDPNPMILHILRANMLLNDVQNVTVHGVGLSDADDTLSFVQHDSNLGGSGFVPRGETVTEAGARALGEMEVRHAGRFVAPLLGPDERVGLIKIDVEGLEDRVLDGLRDVVAGHKPVLLIEVTGDEVGDRVRALVEEMGYDPIHEIHNDLRFGADPLPRRLFRAAGRGVTYELRPMNAFDDRIYPMTITAPKGRLAEKGLVEG